ncbi:hypothetical protein H0H87_006625 [Tephrocybe sp. NHM501043]|nr:hypothetical protein H0H87_006625 [Tephrocybe sp. NHM501043]
MFTIARGVTNCIPRTPASRISTRSFAEVVGAPTVSSDASPAHYKRPRKLHRILKEKAPVREDHGLYGFFRKKENADELTGEAKYEVVEESASKQKQTGRSWRASELRLKSFKDLHTLWYILLRERNLLATQKEEARRMGVSDTFSQVSLSRVHHTRKAMARIKAVLNERRLAYEGALEIVEGEREEKIDQEVQNCMEGAWHRKAQHLKRRQAYLTRRREMQLAKRAAAGKATKPLSTPTVPKSTTSPELTRPESEAGLETTPQASTTPEVTTAPEITTPLEVTPLSEATTAFDALEATAAPDALEATTMPNVTVTPEATTPPKTTPKTSSPTNPSPRRVSGFIVDK